MLDILEEYCQLRHFKVARIDGQTKGTERQEAIDAFSRPDSDYFIFLLSTRAGGLGINLTAADTVIIYDSDWNPQNDSQATARCHRIGQKQEVTVYRLLTRHTYEYEMFERASRKLAIETVVLNKDVVLSKAPEEGEEKGEEGDEKGEEVEEKGEESELKPDEKLEETESVAPERENGAEENETVEDNEEEIEPHDSQLSALPDSPEASDVESTPARKREKWTSDDEEFVMTSEDEDEDDLSVATKTTQGEEPSVTEKSVDDTYGVPAVPVVPVKKKRGRKPTKPRTLEDELNPYRRSKNEVEEMLRRGLFDCIMDSSVATSMEFFDADIDSILAKNAHPVRFGEGSDV